MLNYLDKLDSLIKSGALSIESSLPLPIFATMKIVQC